MCSFGLSAPRQVPYVLGLDPAAELGRPGYVPPPQPRSTSPLLSGSPEFRGSVLTVATLLCVQSLVLRPRRPSLPPRPPASTPCSRRASSGRRRATTTARPPLHLLDKTRSSAATASRVHLVARIAAWSALLLRGGACVRCTCPRALTVSSTADVDTGA